MGLCKKITTFTIILCLSLIIFGCNNHNITEEYQLIRIHIRANSNLEDDQSVKLVVRDAIVVYLEELLSGVNDFETAYIMLEGSLDETMKIADSVLSREGFCYTSKIYLNNEFFPTRSYDDLVVESGYYDALIVELGEGVGDNWWCVIYPPLCYVTADGTCDGVIYKSLFAEIFKKYFS